MSQHHTQLGKNVVRFYPSCESEEKKLKKRYRKRAHDHPFFVLQVEHPNKQLKNEEIYRQGKLEENRCWHENGHIQRREFFQNGKPEKECRTWFRNGHPQSQVFYRDGKREGEYVYKSFLVSEGPYPFEIREYYINGNDIDLSFTWKKKCGILSMQKLFRIRSVSSIKSYIIPDLLTMIIPK